MPQPENTTPCDHDITRITTEYGWVRCFDCNGFWPSLDAMKRATRTAHDNARRQTAVENAVWEHHIGTIFTLLEDSGLHPVEKKPAKTRQRRTTVRILGLTFTATPANTAHPGTKNRHRHPTTRNRKPSLFP